MSQVSQLRRPQPPMALLPPPVHKWGALAEPVYPLDTMLISRAQSLLIGTVRDVYGLTPAEARAVCEWHQRHTESLRPRSRWALLFTNRRNQQ